MLVCSFVHSSVGLFVHSFVCWFVRSLVCSFKLQYILFYHITVHLHPNSSFGAVQIYNDDDNGYSLVCADYFDDLDAHVICRQLNYLYGISMCCSPFGPPLFPIGVTKLQCTADDIEVQTCAQDTSLTYCPSRKYASVVCSDTSPNTGNKNGIT